MISEVKERLAGFGYAVTSEDRGTLLFVCEKVKNRICNFINASEIPDELFYEAVDMAAGFFLQELKTVNPEALSGLDLDAAVKSVKEGDTEVSYAVGEGSQTAEQRLDYLIGSLTGIRNSQLIRYRKLCW